jgi:hypothetical protein
MPLLQASVELTVLTFIRNGYEGTAVVVVDVVLVVVELDVEVVVEVVVREFTTSQISQICSLIFCKATVLESQVFIPVQPKLGPVYET